MARSLTPRDAHTLMNLLVKEATGQDGTIQAVDSSTFVSAGEQVLATGMENTLNALSLVLGRTFMAVRPYDAKLRIINAINSGAYTSRMRKISFYSRESQASGDWNTQSYTNLAMDYDNGDNGSSSTPSMWVQNQPVPLELNFAGRSVWEDSTTVYEYQVKQAFRSEEEFSSFVAGILTEKGNDIESQKEAFNRMTLLNYIGGVYDLNAGGFMPGSAVDLVAAFNAKFGTSYTGSDLRGAHLKEFLEFFVATVKNTSLVLENRSSNRHWSPAKTINGVNYKLLRHTPKDRQRLILYAPLFNDARAMVMPDIFQPGYLDIPEHEEVLYWQNENVPFGVSVTPAIPDPVNPSTGQIAGNAVALDYVVGVLYDADALMIDYQLDAQAVTPLEARKHYRNIWWTFSKNAINDFTENGVVFYMAS